MGVTSKKASTYTGSERNFWTKYLIRAFGNRLQQFETVRNSWGGFQSAATVCNSLKPATARKRSKTPVVEHKGVVERAGVSSLTTRA
jgi:hypothetical protein